MYDISWILSRKKKKKKNNNNKNLTFNANDLYKMINAIFLRTKCYFLEKKKKCRLLHLWLAL